MDLRWSNAGDPAFLTLTNALDAYMQGMLGAKQAAFAPYNLLDKTQEALLVYDGDQAVACAALKRHVDGSAELKRVFVLPEYRNRGLARLLLAAMEARAREYGCPMLRLETNPAFTAAVRLYESDGFTRTEPFGPYCGMCTLCMGKAL